MASICVKCNCISGYWGSLHTASPCDYLLFKSLPQMPFSVLLSSWRPHPLTNGPGTQIYAPRIPEGRNLDVDRKEFWMLFWQRDRLRELANFPRTTEDQNKHGSTAARVLICQHRLLVPWRGRLTNAVWILLSCAVTAEWMNFCSSCCNI